MLVCGGGFTGVQTQRTAILARERERERGIGRKIKENIAIGER